MKKRTALGHCRLRAIPNLNAFPMFCQTLLHPSCATCSILPSSHAEPTLLSLSNLHAGQYSYTADLLSLETVAPASLSPDPRCVASPLNVLAWQEGLASYPDKAFAAFLLQGIADGFRIGVPADFQGRPAHRNLQSAYDHQQDYLDREESLGRIQHLPPLADPAREPRLQISPFGVIPNKWRLIIDLSSPRGRSVNEAINQDLSSIRYTSLDDAVYLITSLGRNCLLTKLDLKEAYRAVPVQPADKALLAVRWRQATYLDRALPFGLRSAPKIFSALTDGLMWLLHSRGVRRALHYLDDFLLLGPAGSSECKDALEITLATCESVGLPVVPEKTGGPTTCLTFLGIELDTVACQLRLPQDKLDNLHSSVSQWMYSGQEGEVHVQYTSKKTSHKRSVQRGARFIQPPFKPRLPRSLPVQLPFKPRLL